MAPWTLFYLLLRLLCLSKSLGEPLLFRSGEVRPWEFSSLHTLCPAPCSHCSLEDQLFWFADVTADVTFAKVTTFGQEIRTPNWEVLLGSLLFSVVASIFFFKQHSLLQYRLLILETRRNKKNYLVSMELEIKTNYLGNLPEWGVK